MRIAMCCTGGHYYKWTGGTRFYDWYSQFSRVNDNFDCYVMSWRPEEEVPKPVKAEDSGLTVLYRENNGLDSGCYHDFIEYIAKEHRDRYDYIIVCHDDMVSKDPAWPNKLIEFTDRNERFELTSIQGAGFTAHRVAQYVSSNWQDIVKAVISQIVCHRVSDVLFQKNPWVLISGENQSVRITGNQAMLMSTLNMHQIWGPTRVGWAASETDGGDPDLLNAVVHYRRGKKIRPMRVSEEQGWPDYTTTKLKLNATTLHNVAMKRNFTPEWLDEYRKSNWKK